MRIENSKRNIINAWIFQLVHIVCQFFSRTAIIYFLSIEYVGLSGLFSNVLSMLSLAELGIGEAIIFSLYRPISEQDESTIKPIMAFYKKVYLSVGTFIVVIGIAITPFIDFFIKNKPDIPNLQLIYALYVINTAVSYFFSYRATFVTATQKNYLVVRNTGIFEICTVVVQVLILMLFKDYIGYMVVGISFTILQNVSITFIANKKYPYLKEKCGEKIPENIFTEIKKNTGAMVFHKIGTILVFATDNLIISKFIGLVAVGLYANYLILANAVTTFISKFFTAISASVGNLAVERDESYQERALFRVMFINYILYSVACTCLFVLSNDFIGKIWLGSKYMISQWTVLLLVIRIFISGMRSSVQVFKNAKGLYWQNKFMPIYESVINLVASIALVGRLGLDGVIIGTIISSVATCVWIEPRVLYKYGFKKSTVTYWINYLKYGAIFGITIVISFYLLRKIEIANITYFGLKAIACLIISSILSLVLFLRTDEFNYLLSLLKSINTGKWGMAMNKISNKIGSILVILLGLSTIAANSIVGKYYGEGVIRINALLSILTLIIGIFLILIKLKADKIKWIKSNYLIIGYFVIRTITIVCLGFDYSTIRSVILEAAILIGVVELIRYNSNIKPMLIRLMIVANFILNLINAIWYIYIHIFNNVELNVESGKIAFNLMYTNPNSLGIMTGLSMLLYCSYCKSSNIFAKIFSIIYVFFQLWILYMSGARSAQVGIAMCLIMLIIVKVILKCKRCNNSYEHKIKKAAILLVFIMSISLMGGITYYQYINNSRSVAELNEYETKLNNFSSQRYIIWKTAFRAHSGLVLGIGSQSKEIKSRTAFLKIDLLKIGIDEKNPNYKSYIVQEHLSTHNGYLAMLYCTGILGAITFFMGLLRMIFRSHLIYEKKSFLIVVYFLVINLFESMMIVSGFFTVFYIIALIAEEKNCYKLS